MKLNPILFLSILISMIGCKSIDKTSVYKSPNLIIEKLTKNTYRHISYLLTDDFGKVSCNGMVVIDNHEALIFDTPTNDSDAKELIDWLENSLHCKIKAVVITHFHKDCLGGLAEFHKRKIPSYASFKTIELAKSNSEKTPENGFEKYLELNVGNKKVINEWLGEGHTVDNIVSYFPEEHVLFGGCLIKSLEANKGYLGDANVDEWSKTVQSVKDRFPEVKIVIPGHGKPGNSELLDYTVELFKK